MDILGIETSCDETSVAVVRDGCEILSNAVASQISLHARYGGVVPELAAREHLTAIGPVLNQALEQAGKDLHGIDAVAVTNQPGLVPSILIGVSFARGLALALDCSLIGINHFVAHIYGAFIQKAEALTVSENFPVLALVVSGGHTALVLIRGDGRTSILGRTLDDAAGEAFDKAAKILCLGYPGGPVIDRLARDGDPESHGFPRSLMGKTGKPLRPENRFNFSFSGVKTSLLYAVRDRTLTDGELRDTVAAYQAAIVDVLVEKTIMAAEDSNAPLIVICGGVACNSSLRKKMENAVRDSGRRLIAAPPALCTDNAAMVGGLAFHYLRAGAKSAQDLKIIAKLDYDLGTIPFVSCSGK